MHYTQLYLKFLLIILLFSTLNCNTTDGNLPVSTREGFIQVTGGKVWYRIIGADKKGIPLILVHGGPGAPHDYFEPLEALSDERPVILYDQLGCGNSDKPVDSTLWTIERFTDELAKVRQELSLTHVHILGNSWGCMLTIDYMLRKNPTGVRSIIFSGPCISVSRWIEDQNAYVLQLPDSLQTAIRIAEETGNFTSPEYLAAMDVFYKQHVCRVLPWPDCVNRSFEKMGVEVYKYMWGPSEFTCTGTLRNYERADSLSKLNLPVLFTCGEFDEATPATTAYYQSMLPGSELLVFQGASHLHHIEKTAEFLQAVRSFMSRTE